MNEVRSSLRRFRAIITAWFVTAWNEITLEPALFVYSISGAIVYGSGAQTELILWKVCSVVKGYNDTICENMEAEEHDDIQNEVQIFKNNFSIKDQMFSSWPQIIYIFFAGSLSDRFGRKWLICLPVTGVFVSAVFQLIHYAWIRELPMEFFYLDNWYYYTGGWTMYYMGIYAYGSDVSKPENRAQRLARFDGVEFIAGFLGTLLSPHVFKAGGYYTLYILRLVCVGTALVWWLKTIKTPEELGIVQDSTNNNVTEGDEKKSGDQAQRTFPQKVRHFLVNFVLNPIKELWQTISAKRPNNLRFFLYLNYVVYFFYVTTYAYAGERYLYMAKVFSDFTGEKFANMVAMEQVLSICGLLVVLPLCLNRFNLHEITVQFGLCAIMVTGLTCAGLSRTLWPEFVLSIALTSVHACQWALARAVFTKMVEKHEVGKVFTVVGLLGSTLTFAATPLYKKLYNATIATVPATFLFYSAAAYALIILLNVILFKNRSKFNVGQDKETEDQENQNEMKQREA